MIGLRQDQIELLRDAIATRRLRALVLELDRDYPAQAPHEEYAGEVHDFATALGFEHYEEVRRLAHLMRIDPDRLADHPLSSAIVMVLHDSNRTGAQRLDFIDKYLLPRLLHRDDEEEV